MNINDYIKDATSKIFDAKEKRKVEAELTDHILKHKEFNEEIGYDAEKAEEMAVEKMGEGTDIAEQLGTLHNDFYTPVGDIICTVIWLLLLGGAYYLLKEFIFDDIGTISISISSILGISGLFAICSYITIKRNRFPVCLMNFIGGIGTIVFTYLVSSNICKNAFNFNSLINLLLNGDIPEKSEINSLFSIVLTVITGAFVILTTMASSSYSIKTKNCNNSLFDNHFNKTISKIILLSAIILFVLSALCSTRFFFFQNTIKEKYRNDYNLVLDITEKCETVDDIVSYVNQSSKDFTETKKDNKTIGYSFSSDIGNITISFNIDEEDENKKETATDRLRKIFANAILNTFPESAEKQSDYIVNLAVANLGKYKNGYDSISLAKLRIKPDELDKIYNFTSTTKDNEEYLEFFNTYLPKNLYITPSNNQKNHDSELVYTFTAGNNENAFDTDFNITLRSEKYISIEKQKQNIVEFFKENPNADKDDISKKFNCQAHGPGYSYNEYRNLVKSVFDSVYSEPYTPGHIFSSFEFDGSDLTEESINKRYNDLFIYQLSDDLLFMKRKYKDSTLIIFFSKTNIKFFSIESMEEAEEKYVSSYGGNWRKTRFEPDLVYFDRNGTAYKDYEDIPYFTKNGTRFRFEYDEENKLYYLIGLNGEKYEADFGYIDENSNLYFYVGDEALKKRNPNEPYYYNSDGVRFTKSLETNWDKDGNLINFDDYLPTYD